MIKEKKTYSKKTYPENLHRMLPSCTQLLLVSQEPILCQQLCPPLHLGSSLCSLSMPRLHIKRCEYKLLLNNQKKSQQDIKPTYSAYHVQPVCYSDVAQSRSQAERLGRTLVRTGVRPDPSG